MATSSRQLKVVRAYINWGLSTADKQAPPGSAPLNPSLRDQHVAMTSWLQPTPSESPVDGAMTQLSLLEVLPCVFGRTSTKTSTYHPPVILTVRSYLPPDDSPYSHEPQSIIDRWEVLEDQPQTLHEALVQLGHKNGASAPPSLPVCVFSFFFLLLLYGTVGSLTSPLFRARPVSISSPPSWCPRSLYPST